MRRIITALLVLLTTSAIAQNGGQITGKKNSGLTGTVMVDSVALKVSDSASRVYLSAMKLKSDSIYRRMYQDSVNLAKLGTGVTITGSVTANLDVTDSTNLAGINSKLGGTLTVSLPSGASTETTLSALNSKVPSGLSTSGSRLAIYSPDSIRVFATNGFGSGGSGGTTSLDAVDSTNLANTATNTSRLPSGLTVTSTRLLVDGSGVTQPVSVSSNVNTTISNVTKKTLGTAVVSADTGLVVNAVMHGLTTGGGGGYIDVKVNPSGALTVEATLDSATQRSTIQVSGHDSTTDSRLGVKLLVNPTITNDSSTLSRTTIKVSNFPATQAISGSVTATLDSATQRTTIKVSNFPTTQAVSGTFWQTTQPISGSVTATLDSATQRTTVKISNFPATQPVSFTRLKASTDTVAITGSITATSTAGATAIYDSTWTAVQMDTAGLGAMANSATVGWQSDSVGLRQHKCTDVKIGVKISMANTAPANDKAVYVYVYPIWYDNSTWYFTSGGTTTFPSGANSTYTIASPNNLRLLGVLSYTTTNMVLQDQFILSNAFGSTMPDAFGLVIVDFSGAALHTTNHRIYYSLINKVQR